MLEYKADGKTASITMAGDTVTAANDVCNLISAVYRAMAESDSDSTILFRALIQTAVDADGIWTVGGRKKNADPVGEKIRAAIANELYTKYMETEFSEGGCERC